MKHYVSKLHRYLQRKYDSIRMRVIFVPQYLQLKKQENTRFSVRWRDRWPCYTDATKITGFDKHYIYHPAWAARVLAEIKPKKHIDISSTLYFCVNVSAYIPVEFYDYRPAQIELDGLVCKKGNLMGLPFDDGIVESLSCMHVIEHVGLGRYGDPIDYNGDIKSANELMRVLKTGGHLIIVVPIGHKPRIQFNAHRIYTYDALVAMFEALTLIEFSLIPDQSGEGLIRHASRDQANMQRYGCGCFLFRKIA